MKSTFFSMFLLFCFLGLSTGLQAQTCTAAQKAACKKICAAKKKCSATDMALCKAICNPAKSVANLETSGAGKCQPASCLKVAENKKAEPATDVELVQVAEVKTVALKEEQ